MKRVRSEAPTRRVDNGKVKWVARYTNPVTGKREIAKPAWNRGKGTFDLKKDAQRAITEAYGLATAGGTFGSYFDGWLDRHPRAPRTNATYTGKFEAVKDVPIQGKALKDWPITDFKRKHALELVAYLLVEQKRARKGAIGVVRVLSAMCEDAITDEVAEANGFRGVKVRSDDRRIVKKPHKAQVLSWDEMHAFAAASPKNSEGLIRVLSDCGLRIGEALALERADFNAAEGSLRVHQTAFEGKTTEGLKGKRDPDKDDAERLVPVPAELAALLAAQPARLKSKLLFTTPRGMLWRYRNFMRDVWNPTCEATGLTPTPHDFRHSFVTHMRAAGINDEDLAAITGHNVMTMIEFYSHPLQRSFDQVRKAVGE